MLGLWLADGATVVHFAPWSPVPGPLCSTLGWHDLTERRWDNERQCMVYLTSSGRPVLSGMLQDAPAHLRVCCRCQRRWQWQAEVLASEVARRG